MNKCNHTLGYHRLRGQMCLVDVHRFLRERFALVVQFNYCPDCGVKLDWEEIAIGEPKLTEDKSNG